MTATKRQLAAARRIAQPLAYSRVAPCGCVFADPEEYLPSYPCRDAAALETMARFAEAIMRAANGAPFFARLAQTTRAAFEEHTGKRPPGSGSHAEPAEMPAAAIEEAHP